MTAQPRFVRTDWGVEMIGEWPPEMSITRELIEQADPEVLERRGRTVTFKPNHSIASYRMVRCDRSTRVYTLVRQ